MKAATLTSLGLVIVMMAVPSNAVNSSGLGPL